MTNGILVAATEPSAQVALFSLLSLVVTTLGAFGVAWIALQHAKLNKVVQTLEKNTNSMKDALVASTAKASRFEGKSEGILQEQQDEAARKSCKSSESESVEGSKPLAQAIKEVPRKTAVEVVKRLEDLDP